MRDVLTIIKFELAAMVRSARIWVAALIYGLCGCIAGLIYIMTVRAVREGVVQVTTGMAARGGGGAGPGSVDGLGSAAYRKLIEFFAGGDTAMIRALIDVPPVLLFAFWGTLKFMPLLLVLFSYDQMAADVQHRSVSFPLLRTSRPALFAGKLSAHVLLYLGLVVVLNTTLFLMGMALLGDFDMTAGLIFQIKSYLLLIPFGLCYLALVAMWSSLTQSPFAALLASFASLLVLGFLSWFDKLRHLGPQGESLAWVVNLSPSHWERGLWSPDPALWGPSVGAYLAFGAVFCALGLLCFTRRDL